MTTVTDTPLPKAVEVGILRKIIAKPPIKKVGADNIKKIDLIEVIHDFFKDTEAAVSKDSLKKKRMEDLYLIVKKCNIDVKSTLNRVHGIVTEQPGDAVDEKPAEPPVDLNHGREVKRADNIEVAKIPNLKAVADDTEDVEAVFKKINETLRVLISQISILYQTLKD